MGLVYCDLEQLDEALKYSQESLEIQLSNFGEDYIASAENLMIIGNVMRKR